MSPTSVVVVEDSPLQRMMLVRAIEETAEAIVVGEAASCEAAIDTVARLRPDVVTMDLEIPGGSGHGPGAGGLDAIGEIMARTPTPILVLSAHAGAADSDCTMRALAAGATDAVPKPVEWTAASRESLRRRVRTLRGVAVIGRSRASARARETPRPSADPVVVAPRARAGAAVPSFPAGTLADPRTSAQIVGIVASTGGPLALRRLIGELVGLAAPVLVVQHLHPEFTAGFVSWLADTTGARVRQPRAGAHPEPGEVLIAPGGRHLRLAAGGRLTLGESPETLHRPSGDELLYSLAEHAGARAVGIVLTGMGEDGAAGLRALRDRGGLCLAQDRDSCAVYGMPQAAVTLGAVDHGSTIPEIAAAVSAIAGRTRALR